MKLPSLAKIIRVGNIFGRLPFSALFWLICFQAFFYLKTAPLVIFDSGDEANYLAGVDFSYPRFELSFLYTCWYTVLNFLTGDPMRSFWISHVVTSSAIVILFFLFMRRLGSHPVWALICSINLFLWQHLTGYPVKANYFAAALLMGAIYLALKKYTSLHSRLFFFSVCCIWLCFLRQEYLIFAAFSLAFAAKGLFRERRNLRPYLLLLFSAIVALGLMLVASPFTQRRTWEVFRAHYSGYSGISHNFFSFERAFPNSRSISGAIAENPQAAFTYFKANWAQLSQLFPHDLAPYGGAYSFLLATFAIFLAALLLYRSSRLHRRPPAPTDIEFIGLITIFSLIKAAILLTLFRYDPKLALEIHVFGALVLAVLMDPIAGAPPLHRWPRWALPISGTAWILLLSLTQFSNPPTTWVNETNLDFTEMVKKLRAHSHILQGKKIVQLANHSSYLNQETIPIFNPQSYISLEYSSAEEYLEKKEADMILFSETDRAFYHDTMGARGFSEYENYIKRCFAPVLRSKLTTLYERKASCATKSASTNALYFPQPS